MSQCLHRPGRRRGAEVADAAGGERRVVGKHGLAQQRFRDRRAERVGEPGQFVARAERALSGQDGDALCRN